MHGIKASRMSGAYIRKASEFLPVQTKIRPFEGRDLDSVLELAGKYTSFDITSTERDFTLVSKFPQTFLVAERDSRIVGFAYGYFRDIPKEALYKWGAKKVGYLAENGRRRRLQTERHRRTTPSESVGRLEKGRSKSRLPRLPFRSEGGQSTLREARIHGAGGSDETVALGSGLMSKLGAKSA